jgi:tetratricopeptide (TPR) repeat protein
MRILIMILVLFASAGNSACSQDAPVPETLERARQLIEAKELDKANLLLSDLSQKYPQNETVLMELGKVQLAQGLNDDALKSFEAVLGVHADSAPARDGEVKAAVAAALADRTVGIDGSALLYLIRARKFAPDSPELLFDFGVQAENMRIYRDADSALTKAHELAPEDAKILYALARVQLDEQKMTEAEANLRAYLAVRPNDATAHYGLGRLLHMLLRNDDARAELEQSLIMQPRQSASYYELGEIALEMHQTIEAKSDYEKVLELAPRHGGALTGMGILAFRAKDYAKADDYLKSAVLYASDYPRAHYYYAIVLARLGRQDESKTEAELATRLDEEQTKTSHGNFLTEIH